MQIILREAFQDHPLFARLLELHDIPDQIYIEGALPEVTIDEYGRATPRILTVVGSRKHTTYGEDALRFLLSSLANQPVVILSGLAFGIDTLAHKEALRQNLITISAPGSGLDKKVIYPKQHLPLAEEIIESGGALISELPPLTQSAPWVFPARNRIKAALSDAVLIIEAEEKSGTLITARLALELGRDIGAVPGEIFSSTSDGTNMLIREGAHVIRNSKDLFDLLHLSHPEKEKEDTNTSYTKEESLLLSLLNEPKEKDILLLESGLALSEFLTTLSALEMKGCVHETFGEVRKVV